MSVIAGAGAQKLYFTLAAPWLFSAVYAEKHGAGNRVKHYIERRVALHYKSRLGDAQKLGKQALCLGDTVQHAVVSAVKSALGAAALGIMYNSEHSLGNGKLLFARLASCYIKVDALCFPRGKLRSDILKLAGKLGSAFVFIFVHDKIPFPSRRRRFCVF